MRKRSEAAEGESRPQVELRVPIDPINEQVVLAAALVDEPARKRYVRSIPADSFHVDQHRAIWEALAEMARRALAYDPATLQSIVGERASPEYIAELVEARPRAPENLEYHVDRLSWDRQRSEGSRGALSALIEAVRDPRASPDRVQALAKAVGGAFDGYADRQFIYDPRALVAEQMLEVRARREGTTNYPFGIDGLDYEPIAFDGTTHRRSRLTPGAKPGLVTIVTGVSSGGKSTLAAHMILGLESVGRRPLVGAWEVEAPMTLEMLARIRLRWPRQEPPGEPLSSDREDELQATMHALSQRIVFFKNPFRRSSAGRVTNAGNLDLIQAVIQDSGCDVFVADLWARCLASKEKDPQDEDEALTRQQAMLSEMKVHGVLVHQQRLKDLETRADKRPTREGIKGSGTYVEVADLMLGVHRPAMWKRVTDDVLEVYVLKQRFGPAPFGIEFEWSGANGSIAGGRSIAYEAQNEMYAGDLGSRFRAPRGGDDGAPRGGARGRKG